MSDSTREDRDLVAFYDLSVAPTSFDFATFLTRVEWRRRELGAKRFRVAIVPADGSGFWDREPFSVEAKRSRLQCLLMPLGELFPHCGGVDVCASRDEAEALARDRRTLHFPDGYTPRAPLPDTFQWAHVVAARICGDELPGWSAPAAARREASDWLAAQGAVGRVVSITLREATYHTENNSRVTEWGRFARTLSRSGFFPVIVRDSERADEPPPIDLRGIPIYREAALDVRVRAALYARSWLNLSVATGPMMLMWLDPRCHSVVWKLLNPDNFRSTPTPIRSMGIEVGGQVPGISPSHRLFWREDSREALEAGFDAALARLSGDDELKPEQEPALVTAQRLRDTARLEPACRIYRHLEQLDPGDPFPLYGRCLAELRRPERPRWERALRGASLFVRARARARRLANASVHELLELALCHERFAFHAVAERAYRRALEVDPQQPLALQRLGVSALRRGRTGAAVELLQRAVERDPYRPECHWHLGRALRESGDRAGACEHFAQAALYDPSHTQAASALAELGAQHGS
jgi:tetratricopeptide (TPR) repeat protein